MSKALIITGIVHTKPLNTIKDILDEMELALVTVQDVIARNADGASFEDSYIGVNLGLYVARMDAIIRRCRELSEEPTTATQED